MALDIEHSKEIVFWKEKWIFNLGVPTVETTSKEPWENKVRLNVFYRPFRMVEINLAICFFHIPIEIIYQSNNT